MWKTPALILLVILSAAASVQGENIHQKAARCFAGQGMDCDDVCALCHSKNQDDALPQRWNPSGTTVLELAGDGGDGAFVGDIPLCLMCHEEKSGLNNHPTAISYPRHDPQYASHPTGPKLFCPAEGRDCRIYCSTCHDPHVWDGQGLLRISNRGSALCLACHLK